MIRIEPGLDKVEKEIKEMMMNPLESINKIKKLYFGSEIYFKRIVNWIYFSFEGLQDKLENKNLINSTQAPLFNLSKSEEEVNKL